MPYGPLGSGFATHRNCYYYLGVLFRVLKETFGFGFIMEHVLHAASLAETFGKGSADDSKVVSE